MKCTKCTFELPDDAKFCTGCGTPTASTKACGSCGAENPIFAQFCAGCGKSVVDKVPASKDENSPALDDFIFLLDEESVRGRAVATGANPWGYFSLVLKGGIPSSQATKALRDEIIKQGGGNGNDPGFWGKTLQWFMQLFLAEKTSEEVFNDEVGKTFGTAFKAFFVMDVRNIPLITYSHPVPLAGSPNSTLEFVFWIDPPEDNSLFQGYELPSEAARKTVATIAAKLGVRESFAAITETIEDVKVGLKLVTEDYDIIEKIKKHIEKNGALSDSDLQAISSIASKIGVENSIDTIERASQRAKVAMKLSLNDVDVKELEQSLEDTRKLVVSLNKGNSGNPILNSQQQLGLFFNRCLGEKKSLTTREFRNIAIDQAKKVISTFNIESLNSDPPSAKYIAQELLRLCGISSTCRLVRGKVGERIQFDVSKSAVSVTCPNTDCGTIFSSTMKFCDQCGTTLPKVESDYLVSKDGEQITLRLSLLIDRSYEINVIESQVANEVIKHLAPEIRNLTMAELTEQSALGSLTEKLSAHLTQQFRSYLTEFNIIDIRSTAEDWFFKTDVLIREELRKLEADKQRLTVDDAKINLEEAAFAVAMRRARFEYDAELEEDQARYNAEFKQRKVLLEDRLRNVEIEAESDLRVKEIETKRDLASEKIDDEADKTRLEREAARRDLERSIDKKEAKNEREDEVDGLAHDQSLEKKMAAHDIDLADMTGEAESRAKRREVGDQSFEEEEQIRLRVKAEEEQIRLQAKALQDVGGAEENLEDRRQARKNDELRVLADIEANMEKRENEFKLSKIDSMKGLSAQELLAMQAAELAKAAGGGDATANLIKSIADSQAASAGAGIKDDMYKQMLEIQRQASESAIQAHKEASATAVGAHKEAAATSQSVNEKSMEMMSKVAEKAAGAVDTKLSIVTKLGNTETEKEAKPKVSKCIAPECDATWPAEEKKKFCVKCGASQQSTQ